MKDRIRIFALILSLVVPVSLYGQSRMVKKARKASEKGELGRAAAFYEESLKKSDDASIRDHFGEVVYEDRPPGSGIGAPGNLAQHGSLEPGERCFCMQIPCCKMENTPKHAGNMKN